MLRLKEFRERNNMTQQEIADALGVSRTRYSNWESGYREINFIDACLLADIYNCTLDELAGRDFPQAPALTPAESTLLDTYRTTDARGRESIDSVATAQRGTDETKSDMDTGRKAAG
ncbi:MAG: helix-turn-helix transcriptional regulator [Coriobacteriales bacterium]|nr:helix-turn-helix transcriptional regulator [Coriobacteriales bacterium]